MLSLCPTAHLYLWAWCFLYYLLYTICVYCSWGNDGEMGEHPRQTILCFGAYIILEVHVLKFGLQLVALLESDKT